jgi:hypothetical protein
MALRPCASRLTHRSIEADRLVRGRTFECFDQMQDGVRVFGADVTRQTNEFGQAVPQRKARPGTGRARCVQ